MKQIKTLSAIAALTAMMTTTSCHDNMDQNDSHQGISQNTEDYLCGTSNLIVAANQLDSKRVELTTSNVKISNSNTDLSYTVEMDKDGYYLMPHLNGANNEQHYDKVVITSTDGTKEETMLVTIDPATNLTRGSMKDYLGEREERATYMVGWGVDVLENIGNRKERIIDLEKFGESPEMKSRLREAFTANTENAHTTYSCTTGSTLSEITKSVEKKIGVHFNIPIKCINVKGGYDKTHFSETKTTEQNKYLMATVDVKDFEANLNTFTLCDRLQIEQEGKKANWTDEEIDVHCHASLLSDAANNAINYKGTTGRYNTTEEGMMNLIDDFGTHVVTEVQYGAKAELSYSMRDYSTSTNIKDVIGYEFGISSASTTEKKTETTGEKKDTTNNAITKSIVTNVVKPDPWSVSANMSNTNETKEFFQSLETKRCCKITGGLQISNYDNLDSWQPGSIQKMVPLAYGTESTISRMDYNKENSSLIPLYKFCTDSKRRELLKNLLTPRQSDGVIPYYEKRMMVDAGSADREMVIADVKLVYVGTLNLTNNMVKPMKMKDYYGVEHTYYPMIQTDEQLHTGSDEGSAYVFSQKGRAATLNYSLATGINFWNQNHGRTLCYYALEWSDKCYGITDIRLMDCHDAGKYSRKTEGTAANIKHIIDGVEWWEGSQTSNGRDDDIRTGEKGCKYLYITYGNKDTKNCDKIKGVAWHFGNPDEPYKGNIIAASGGTEKGITNRFTDDEAKEFSYYWHTKGNVKCSYTDGGWFTHYETHWKSGWGPWSDEGWSAEEPSWKVRLHPVFTTKSIKRDMTKMVKNDAGEMTLPIAYPRPY